MGTQALLAARHARVAKLIAACEKPKASLLAATWVTHKKIGTEQIFSEEKEGVLGVVQLILCSPETRIVDRVSEAKRYVEELPAEQQQDAAGQIADFLGAPSGNGRDTYRDELVQEIETAGESPQDARKQCDDLSREIYRMAGRDLAAMTQADVEALPPDLSASTGEQPAIQPVRPGPEGTRREPIRQSFPVPEQAKTVEQIVNELLGDTQTRLSTLRRLFNEESPDFSAIIDEYASRLENEGVETWRRTLLVNIVPEIKEIAGRILFAYAATQDKEIESRKGALAAVFNEIQITAGDLTLNLNDGHVISKLETLVQDPDEKLRGAATEFSKIVFILGQSVDTQAETVAVNTGDPTHQKEYARKALSILNGTEQEG